MLSKEEVKHIAKLARLSLKEEEIDIFSVQLNDILQYTEQLNKLDTENVVETSQVTGLSNVSQNDKIEKKCTGEELLLSSPMPVERKQIRVKPVITQ